MKRSTKVAIVSLAVVLALVVAGIALTFLGVPNPFSKAANVAGTGAANAVLDISGIKERAESAMRNNVSGISGALGMTNAEVEAMIDDIDVDNWKVTSLPSDAVSTGTKNIDFQGTSAEVTLYEDPSYVTVDVGGTKLTLEVPDTAQGYMPLLENW